MNIENLAMLTFTVDNVIICLKESISHSFYNAGNAKEKVVFTSTMQEVYF